MNTYATTLLKSAYEIKNQPFWKLFLENIEREVRRKRYDLESVQPDRLQFNQGYIAALRFVIGDSRGDLKSLPDKIIEDLKTTGTTE